MKTLDEILEGVCNFYGIEVAEVAVPSRQVELVKARQQYCHIAKEATKKSLREIGEKIGRDHATVIHACKQVNNLLETDKAYKAEFLELKEKILSEPVIFEPIDIDEIIKQTNEI
jgi:chromosomal replication initiator protein